MAARTSGLVCLLFGIVAAVLGLSGIAAIATQISWALFVVWNRVPDHSRSEGAYASSGLAGSEKLFRHSRKSRTCTSGIRTLLVVSGTGYGRHSESILTPVHLLVASP
jgi:hypothetical protein